MACDIQTLVNESQCIMDCMGKSQMDAAELSILCNLLQSGGGTGTGSVLCGNGAPVADPGVNCAIYYDLTQGDIYKWRDSTGLWDA